MTKGRWDLAGLAVAVLVLCGVTAVGQRATLLPFWLNFSTPVHTAATVSVAVLCAATVWIAHRHPWPLFLVASAFYLTQSLLPPMIAAAYVAGSQLVRRSQLVWCGCLTTALVIVMAFVTSADVLGTAGSNLIFVALGFAVGLLVRARRQVADGIGEAHQVEIERTRISERARIAREMHDVVAHQVSLMVLHAGGLEMNLTDPKLVAEAELIRTTGREALTQLRQVLGVLRSPHATGAAVEPPPTLTELDTLVEQSALPVTCIVEGVQRSLPAAVEGTAYRLVQEALTNVRKHASGATAEIVLRYLPSTLEVSVRNGPPTGPSLSLPGSGLGLVGIRERIDLLHGDFSSQHRLDGGFVVSARIPTGPGEQS